MCLVNALNQYTTTLIPGLENQAPEYDDRGNMLSDGTRTLTYDAQDRLTSVIMGDVKTTFEYDYLGRRTTKTVYDTDGQGGWTWRETRTFAYDGWNVMAEYLTDAEHSTATLARTYAWGPSLGGGIGGLLSVTDHLATSGPATYVPVFDGNGNVLALTDTLGQVVASYQYDPYGKLISASDATTTWQADATGVLSAPAGSAVMVDPFLFSTRYCDLETGLYDFGMRYYAPDLQRWINRDPIEESGGVNLYAYCGSDPVNRVDPTGLEPEEPEQTHEVLGTRILPRQGIFVIRAEGTYLDWTGPTRTISRQTPDGWYVPNPGDSQSGPEGWLVVRGGVVYEVEGAQLWGNVLYRSERVWIGPPASGAKKIDAWALADAIVGEYHDALTSLQAVCDAGQTIADGVTDLIPFLNVAKAASEAITGRSFTKANTTVSSSQRTIGFIVAGVAALKVVHWAADVSREVVAGVKLAGSAEPAVKMESRIVYRGLAKGENPTLGLWARAPGAGNSVVSHVAGKRPSQWISVTTDKAVAMERFGEHGTVAIDLSKVTSQIVDLSEGIPGMAGTMISRWAKKMREILVKDFIPPEAITPLK